MSVWRSLGSRCAPLLHIARRTAPPCPGKLVARPRESDSFGPGPTVAAAADPERRRPRGRMGLVHETHQSCCVPFVQASIDLKTRHA